MRRRASSGACGIAGGGVSTGRLGGTLAGWLAVALAAGCGKEEAKPGVADAEMHASAAPSASAPPPTPAPPRPPTITLDEQACSIDRTRFTGAPAEWRDRAAALLGETPLVAGESVTVNVMRDAKSPRVVALVAALAAAKARSVVVHTPTRDLSSGELELTLHAGAVPECSAVAMIEHDGAVAVWSKGGGGASRFARGMAGPDLSSSTEALRKRAGGCASPVWFLGGAESVTWGLLFDLATRARGGEGATLKPTKAVLLTQAAVPGRAVKED